MIKKKQKTTLTAAEKPAYKLTPEDMREFELRRMTLNTAKCQFLMVEEAYQMWIKGVRIRYDIPTPKFHIDAITGAVTPEGDRNDLKEVTGG